MGNKVLSQAEAWDLYDDWLEHGHAAYVEEPPAIELTFRTLTTSGQAAPKDWADSYVSAFAQISGLRLVTFNQALHRRTTEAVLLKPMAKM
jgi:uncharacterized protein